MPKPDRYLHLTDPTKAELTKAALTGDPLPDFTRSIIGRSIQLRLPLRDPIDMRRQAIILRTLANRLEVLSHSKEPAGTILSSAWFEGRQAQARLQSHSVDGRK